MLPLPTAEMSIDEMVANIQRIGNDGFQMLRNASPQLVRMMYFQVCAHFNAIRDDISRNTSGDNELITPTHHHNGANAL